ncbi:MAG TPA: arylsulfotransferase family protein [Gaiellaceae bacterium]
MKQTRREFLATAAGASLAVALPRVAAAAGAAGVATYRTEPSLQVPTLRVTARTAPGPGYLFVTTLTGPGHRGPMIVDDRGNLVWFRRTSKVAINFRRQAYRGRPVLTWWEGDITQIGTGQGEGVIVDTSYKEIARVRAGNGYAADVHELLLTPQGTALITIYDQKTVDLSSIGGPSAHPTLDSIVQEVDVASGKVLFEWHSLDHVSIADSYSPILSPFDYFHVNSIDVDLDGNLLVSARNTWGVYKLDRRTGQIVWTLGGRRSDFQLGPGALFMYQHDARAHPDGTLTLFDDGPGNASHPSRAVRLGLDPRGRTAVLLQEFPHPTPPLASFAMGNAQFAPDGTVVVGWGTSPYVTEFGPLGDVRLDATFDGGAWNYRAFRDPWAGRPAHPPSIAVRRRGGSATVYASFNGSTDTAHWTVLGGPSRAALRPLKTVAATGFETAVRVPNARALAVQALDVHRRPLGTSRVV